MKTNSLKLDDSLISLFERELSDFIKEINETLLLLEKDPNHLKHIEKLARIFHSIKGSANLVQQEELATISHSIEELLDHALKIDKGLSKDLLEKLFKTADLLKTFEKSKVIQNEPSRILKISAHHLDKLVGFAGELVVESNWLQPHLDKLLSIKSTTNELLNLLDQLRAASSFNQQSETIQPYVEKIHDLLQSIRFNYVKDIDQLEEFSRIHSSLIERHYLEVLKIRMRPFGDLLEEMPRMVRDMSKELGKEVQLIIVGKETLVDRDILERLESQITHLVKNALDHGIELPNVRLALKKPSIGTITISARHLKGLLNITISDDGSGINLSRIKEKLGITNIEDQEALSRLFQPGFTTKESVSMISGRGFGLDSVKKFIDEIGGSIKLENEKNKGTTIHLELPLTLSLIRALVILDQNEPYAIPLSKIEKTVVVNEEMIKKIEGGTFYFDEDKQKNISITPLTTIFNGNKVSLRFPQTLLLVNKEDQIYGIAIEKILEQKELVVKKLDERLGSVPYVLAGATLENGSPILILDVGEMVKSL